MRVVRARVLLGCLVEAAALGCLAVAVVVSWQVRQDSFPYTPGSSRNEVFIDLPDPLPWLLAATALHVIGLVLLLVPRREALSRRS